MLFEAFAILGEGGGIEGVVAGLHVEKPAEQQVEVDLFAELPFTAEGVEGHEKKGFEEPFRRYAGSTGGAVGGFKSQMESVEDAICASLHVAKGMVRTDAVFHFERMEQWQLLIGMSAHQGLPLRLGEFSAIVFAWQ